MTYTEMKELFLIEYDRYTNFDAPGYTDKEISETLTSAQEELIFHTYNPLGNKYHEGLEEVELTTADLQELVMSDVLIVSDDQDGVFTNGVFYDLPSDHWLTLTEIATISSDDDCFDGKVDVIKPITHDEYSINKDNPFKKPAPDEVTWRLTHSDSRFELITDGTYTVSAYNMRYLSRPTPIIVGDVTVNSVQGPLDCSLKDTTHRRIIKYAVRIAASITTPEMYQIKTMEQNLGN